MIYYRIALQGSQSATWRWKSSPLTSLHGVLGMLKLYHCVPNEHIRVFLSSSIEQMDKMLSRANQALPSTAVSLVLKGVTGDTGTTITPATNFPGVPLLLPLGASPSIGMLNNSSTAVTVNVVFV